jgi:putative peptidoglycan lipid II flippase
VTTNPTPPKPEPTQQGQTGQAVPSRAAAVQPGLGAAVRAASLVTLTSRFFGMLRDVLIVQVFGAGALASSFSAAFQIPNLFRRLFGEGALSAAFIPEYTLTAKRDHDEADKLATYTLLRLGWVTAVITVIVELVLLALLLILPGEERHTSLQLMMVMFPFMPAICMAAILSAMLQVHGRFGASMTGTFFLNTFIVAVCVFYMFSGKKADATVAYVLCVATVLSGFAQCYWFSRLLKKNFTWRPDCDSAKPAGKRMLRTFIPVMIGLGGLQLSSLLDLAITMYPIWVGDHLLGEPYPLDVKSNIILRSTSLFYHFPLGVFGVAVATAAFPMLTRSAENPALFLDTLRRGLRLSIFIGLPASLGLILVREDVTRVLFSFKQGAGFKDPELARSAAVLMGFAPAVWAFSLNQLLTRAFYAKGDTLTPVRVSLILVAINFVLNVVGIWWLKEAAIAWATSVTAIAQTCVLMYIAKKRFCPAGEPILDGPTRRSVGRIAAAVVVMGAIVLLTKRVWELPPESSRWLLLLRMLLYVGLGAGAYAGEALYSRSPELSWLTSRSNRHTKGQYRDLVVD